MDAIIVQLQIRVFPNTRKDKVITEEVQRDKRLTEKAGGWVKNKLDDASLKGVRSAASLARKVHYTLTLPFDDGQQVLTIGAIELYEQKMREARDLFNRKAIEWIGSYPELVEQSKEIHGDTWDATDYPPASEVEKMFHFAILKRPVPHSEHFEKNLRDVFGKQLEQDVAERLEAAQKAAWDRLLKPVQAMADTLSAPAAIFRDSLVENLKEVVEVAPSLNIDGSAELNAAIQQVKTSLATLDPQVLRDSKVARAVAAGAATSILEQFGALGSRKLVLD